jgi:hypothetical protein
MRCASSASVRSRELLYNVQPVSKHIGQEAIRGNLANSSYACRERVGKYFIQLCGTTPCMVNGSEEIKATICKHLGIHEGGKPSVACAASIATRNIVDVQKRRLMGYSR